MAINALVVEHQRECSYDWAVRIAESTGDWTKKVRRIALLVNFILQWRENRPKLKKKIPVTKLLPTTAGMERAENKLVGGIQQKHFKKEIQGLRIQNAEMRSKTSSLTALNPFVDSEGLLRAGGRLANATNLSYDTKYPKILPSSDPEVESLIISNHEAQGHAGVNHTFSWLQQHFWILDGREAVKRVVHKCFPCQKALKAPVPQKMAALPAERVDAVCAPFERTGIDVFGPFRVRISPRSYQKRWVLLFTCLTCRAVHFEILKDMSAPTFINALVRFHSRRPGLRILFSDNGTNFRGAAREMQSAITAWNTATAGDLILRGVEWKFAPPNSPHWGGVWERIVREAKRHLALLLTEKQVDLDVFTTVLVEVERIMNSRPLTYASSDIRDMTVLTPNCFLYPGIVTHSSTNILPPTPPGGDDLRYSWRKARCLVDLFWDRWTREYLHTLHRRTKWKSTSRNPLYVSQLVLILDEQMPRDQWKLARVVSLKGDPAHARTAVVETAAGKQYERHCTKLVPLELD